MPVRVMHLGVTEAARIDEVLDDGRTLVVGADTFTLRRINGWFRAPRGALLRDATPARRVVAVRGSGREVNAAAGAVTRVRPSASRARRSAATSASPRRGR
jgi:hypothetical protein